MTAMKREEELTAMTPERATYFMKRFKSEEKMLGPNEQLALDFVIELLSTSKPEAEPVAWTDATELESLSQNGTGLIWDRNGHDQLNRSRQSFPLYAHHPKPEATEGGAHEKGRDCGENGGPLLESKDCIGAAYTRSLARGLMRETRISLVARTIRQALRNYGHKAAESTLPECIAADVERSLISHQEGAAALTAKEGSDNG